MLRVGRFWILGLCATLVAVSAAVGESRDHIRVATYNLRNYLTMDRVADGSWRPDFPKPESEKRVVRETIRQVSPDILAVQEIGGLDYLRELQTDLAAEGLVYRGIAVLEASDPTRMLGALWKGDLAVEPLDHRDLRISYFGESSQVKRGMLELKVRNGSGRVWASIFVLHLKSKYTDDPRDHQSLERRTREARAARDQILLRMPNPDKDRFLVLGDLNDGPNSRPLKGIASIGDRVVATPLACLDDEGMSWTHFYKKGGLYAQIDYILMSPAWGSPENLPTGRIEGRADFYDGSDHRLVWVDLPR